MANSNVNIKYAHVLVYHLKLNELRKVLDAVQNNKTGNKHSLRNRVLKLLAVSTPQKQSLEQTILQVYNSRLQQNQQPRIPIVQKQHFLLKSQHPNYNHSYTPLKLFPIPNQQFKQIPQVSTLKASQFKNSPFMKTIHCLLNPVDFCYSTLSGVFYLTDNNIRNTILKSWDNAIHEYKTQIVLRLVSFSETTKCLPYNITVYVNGRQCKLPTLNTTTTNGQIPWRNNVPIDITPQTNLINGSLNTIKITWSKESHQYMVGVFVIQKLTLNDLLEQLNNRPSRASEKTQELIKKSMENDIDMGVDSILITLKDPLTKLRMKLPARSVECIHMQCFDVIQFLQMNEQKQTWSCPLCKKNVNFEDIEIDEFFLNLLQSPNLSEECENVFLLKDGTWSEKKTKEISKNVKPINCQSTNNIEVITLSDSDDDDYNNNDLDNDDNEDILPKSKRFKCNPPKVKKSVIISKNINVMANLIKSNARHSSKSEIVKDISRTAESNHGLIKMLNVSSFTKCTRTKPVLNLLNNAYVPNNRIAVTNRKDSIPSSSGSFQNNEHQEKYQPRQVLCVITLD